MLNSLNNSSFGTIIKRLQIKRFVSTKVQWVEDFSFDEIVEKFIFLVCTNLREKINLWQLM
jgi:hypothetical protein